MMIRAEAEVLGESEEFALTNTLPIVEPVGALPAKDKSTPTVAEPPLALILVKEDVVKPTVIPDP
jgi:hypothetical protein